ncbi:unnamed protein product [Lampetra fluviatilis]
MRETRAPQPAQAAAILLAQRDKVPAKLDLLPKFAKEAAPFVRVFTAAGGDWEAFQRCLTATCDLAGWTEVEALRAFTQMAATFDPPSNVRHKFAARRRGGDRDAPRLHPRWSKLG